MSTTYERFKALTTAQQDQVTAECTEISEREMAARFTETLDECSEPYQGIDGMTFLASDILKECDPVAWECMFADYCGCAPYIELNGGFFIEDDVDQAIDSIEENN